MSKLLVLVFALLALLAQQSFAVFFPKAQANEAAVNLAIPNRLEGVCEEIKVTLFAQITIRIGEHNQPLNATLYRLCNSTHLIDFSKPVHFVNIFGEYDNHNYSGNPHFGDKFLAQRDGDQKFIQVLITPKIGNVTMEDVKKYQMIPTLMTTRGPLSKYVKDPEPMRAEVIYERRSWSGETIHLSPGWKVKLSHNEMIEQTLIPGPNSTLKEQKVTVMAEWYNVPPTEGLHVVVDRAIRTNGHVTDPSREFVTIFFKKPEINDPKINPQYVNATIIAEIGKNNHMRKETVSLYPGWLGELKQTLVQTMIPGPNSILASRKVIVYPKYYTFRSDEGFHAEVDLLYSSQTVTVYFGTANIDIDYRTKDSNGVTYLGGQTVPQHNQSLFAENIRLSPGWTGILQHAISQTLVPESDSELTKQNVTIVPGWTLFHDQEGISLFIQTQYADQYVSMYFSDPPKRKH